MIFTYEIVLLPSSEWSIAYMAQISEMNRSKINLKCGRWFAHPALRFGRMGIKWTAI